MARFRPVHGFIVVVLFLGGVLVADYALEGGTRRGDQIRVQPDQEGIVRLDVGSLRKSEVRFYHFINRGNQEVEFFVARDPENQLQVAFDANEICYKKRRGYRAEGDWVVCSSCEKSFRLIEVNAGGGGCKPVPLSFRLAGDQVVLREADILRGWRFFR